VLAIRSQRQTTKFAMEMANIPVTQENSHVKITNEGNAHHFQYQGYCLLCIHSTRPKGQPSLLCGNTEAVT
jgi:hypothetical protein